VAVSSFRFRARLDVSILGAPHLSARGTLTLQNNALLSTHFRIYDDSTRTPFKLCIGSCFHLPSQVLAETELFIMQRASRSASVSVWACDHLARAGLGWPIGEHCFERATEPILIKALVAWVHMIAVFAHEVAAPVRPAAVGVAKRVLIGQPPGAEDAA
jgi:hypothetical protein